MRPTPQQLRWQEQGLGMFVHHGPNTFHGVQWSDGTLPAASFDPTAGSTRTSGCRRRCRWVRATWS